MHLIYALRKLLRSIGQSREYVLRFIEGKNREQAAGINRLLVCEMKIYINKVVVRRNQ